ncbi:hypothetical protein PF008_g21796 [Phytophthora fragariae]|uniref:Uncharacterized protein n=1 Tax=Phytophthora fragariae TaxID=53985 RepID=A0A6G0QWJ5_9STRA|nr:hypothetical protein PF008_g21796 [Phytophthora fragariae]
MELPKVSKAATSAADSGSALRKLLVQGVFHFTGVFSTCVARSCSTRARSTTGNCWRSSRAQNEEAPERQAGQLDAARRTGWRTMCTYCTLAVRTWWCVWE